MAYATIVTNYVVLASVEVYNDISLVAFAHNFSSDALLIDTAFGVVENTLPLAGSTLYIKQQSPNTNKGGEVLIGCSDTYVVDRGSGIFVLDHKYSNSQPEEKELRVLPAELKASNITWGRV